MLNGAPAATPPDVDVAAAGPMMGGSPGISGVLSRMLPGVPEEEDLLKQGEREDDNTIGYTTYHLL